MSLNPQTLNPKRLKPFLNPDSVNLEALNAKPYIFENRPSVELEEAAEAGRRADGRSPPEAGRVRVAGLLGLPTGLSFGSIS